MTKTILWPCWAMAYTENKVFVIGLISIWAGIWCYEDWNIIHMLGKYHFSSIISLNLILFSIKFVFVLMDKLFEIIYYFNTVVRLTFFPWLPFKLRDEILRVWYLVLDQQTSANFNMLLLTWLPPSGKAAVSWLEHCLPYWDQQWGHPEEDTFPWVGWRRFGGLPWGGALSPLQSQAYVKLTLKH